MSAAPDVSTVSAAARATNKARAAISRLDARSSDWRSRLGRNGKNIIGDERNVIASLRLAPELVSCVRFNEFGLRVELARDLPWRQAATGITWTDEDDVALQAWFQERDIPVRQRGVVADSIVLVSRDSAYHPVREYLDALQWDNVPRLNKWLQSYLAATARPEYLTAVPPNSRPPNHHQHGPTRFPEMERPGLFAAGHRPRIQTP